MHTSTGFNNIIVFASLAFVAGILFAGLYKSSVVLLSFLAVILLTLTLWHIWRNIEQSFWPIIGLFFIAGMICYGQAVIIRTNDISHYLEQTVSVEGIIDEIPEQARLDDQSVQVKYVLKVDGVKLDLQGPEVRASGRIRISAQYQSNAKLASYGDRLTVHGKILELHGYNNPGQIDVTAVFKRQNITARMSVQDTSIKIVSAEKVQSWRVTLANWRQNVIMAIQKVMPGNDAAIVTGSLFGGYTGIDREVLKNFTVTGLIHILSVSGTHIALVAGVIIWLGKNLRLRLSFIVLVASLAIILYALVSGFTPPVVRSAVMGLISLFAIGIGREKYVPAALAVTALGMLVYQPLLLYDISFQLSFGATVGLVLLYNKTMEFLAGLPQWLAGPFAVTLSAQLGVLPVMAWYFNSFPLMSFIANLVVLPIIELVVIAGLLGILAYTIVPLAGNVIFVIVSLMIGLVITLTSLLATVPGSVLYLPSMGLVSGSIYYSTLAWLYGWRPKRVPGPRELTMRWPKMCGLVAILIVSTLIFYTWYPRPVAVHFIDVGQGDAALIITPHGQAVLIDTGGSMGSSGFDIGERVILPYLKHYGITSLNYLLLTHGHQDHAGGAAGIAANIKVNNIMLACEAYSPAVQALLRAGSGSKIIPTYADQLIVLDGVMFSIEQAVGDTSEQRAHTGNEVSSVIRISYRQHSFLVTGDLAAVGESELVAKGIKPCTVLKVGHHGAKTSSTPEFLQAVAPQFAVISVGYANHFGHPHLETLKQLNQNHIKVYRTDQDGAIVFRTDGNTMTIEKYLD